MKPKKRPDNSKLHKWLKDKGYLSSLKDTREVTHLLMNGGKVCLPRTAHDTLSFFHAYVSSVSAGEAVYVVENRTKIFKFLCDLDFYDSVPGVANGKLSQADCILCIQKTLREFYPYKSAQERRVIVCTREQAETPRGTSRGVHLVWPNILVNSDIGLNLREAIVAKLHELDDSQPWDAIVDESVYIGNGLRMVGSRKIVKCSECSSGGTECVICDGTGKMDIGRVYTPVMTLSGDGEMMDMEADPLALQMSTSVRVVDHQEGSSNNNPDAIGCPSWFNAGRLFDMNDKKERKRIKKKRAREKDGESENAEQDLEKKTKKKKVLNGIPEDDKRFQAVVNYIKKHFAPKRFGDEPLKITKMVADLGVYFCNTNCTYCENKQGKHKNSTIYFVINPKEIRLKCHCPCPPSISGSIACSEYAGKPVKISAQLRNKLFKKPPSISETASLVIPGKPKAFSFSGGWKSEAELDFGLQVIDKLLLKLADPI